MLWLQVGTMNFLWERISKECGKDSRHRSTRDSSVPFPQSISEGHSSTSSSEHQHPWPSKPFRVGFNSILWSLTRFVVNRDECYLPSSTLPYQFLTMSVLYTRVPLFFSRSAVLQSKSHWPPWPHVLIKSITKTVVKSSDLLVHRPREILFLIYILLAAGGKNILKIYFYSEKYIFSRIWCWKIYFVIIS